MTNSVDTKQKQLATAIPDAVDRAASVITKSYLEELERCDILNPTAEDKDIDITRCGQFFRLSRLVENRAENVLDKLTTVVNVVSATGCTLATLIASDGHEVNYYLGVIDKRHRRRQEKQQREADIAAFRGALSGNLTGSEFLDVSEAELKKIRDRICDTKHGGISAVSGMVSLRGEKDNYVQGIENMVDALRGQKYTLLMIADPLKTSELQIIKQGYERLYTQLSSFKQTVMALQDNRSVSTSTAQSEGFSDSVSQSISMTQSQTHAKGSSFGGNIYGGGAIPGVPFVVGAGVSYSRNRNESMSTGHTDTDTNQRGTSRQTTLMDQTGTSSGRSLQLTSENRSIRSLLDQIDRHLERLDSCNNYGAFNCAAYVLTENKAAALTVASNYNALMRGKNSCLQAAQINTWYKLEDMQKLSTYLGSMVHPRFRFFKDDDVQVTPASIISGSELAVQIGLPQKSISGVTVIPMASFGRNVQPTTGKGIPLGMLYHMGRIEGGQPVSLDKSSLASHTFITGSTGSGKSNTIYHLLDELGRQKVKFLVIEPAKGEYRNVLGGREDVSIYGTNARKAPLLKLNPFSFPEDTHVLEHIDRLVEIFNACWPMYAAMPAVLKDAVERAYITCGWNLTDSTCVTGKFPTFVDLMELLPDVVKRSGYSADTQNDYIGALFTRIKSLTNGINGQIFCADKEIPAEKLFDENVIIDLSRVGSMETKSLLMGIMVLKLQEHRMENGDMNAELHHVTVLEEAHNLLRRTSDVQTQESSNLQGKSVEMIANAIAEMRTYGEGFIIADQAPGLMDPAVIRNTNTKIIMRLPDESDRELVGKAASLNDDQITELAKLPLGVAAVYQNDWLEPVLCRIARFEDEQTFSYTPMQNKPDPIAEKVCNYLISGAREPLALRKEDADAVKKWIAAQKLTADIERELLWLIGHGTENTKAAPKILYCLTRGKGLIQDTETIVDVTDRQTAVDNRICNELCIRNDIASEIRRQIFAYAADKMSDDLERSHTLLYYGGVR